MANQIIKDYYAILGVKPDASKNEIKQAFRKLALIKHPDKNVRNTHIEFIDLKQAFDILYDENQRSEYDKLIKSTNSKEEKEKFRDVSEYRQTANTSKEYESDRKEKLTIMYSVAGVGVLICNSIWFITSGSDHGIIGNIGGVIWSSFWGFCLGFVLGTYLAKVS